MIVHIHAVEMSNHGLLMYMSSALKALGIHIKQISHAHVATITCFNICTKNGSEGGQFKALVPLHITDVDK